MQTKVTRHPRKGTRGVRSYKRNLPIIKSVPHSTEDYEFMKITKRMRRLERKFDKLTAEKDNISNMLSSNSTQKSFRRKKDAHARIREIDNELMKIGSEWGALGMKTKGYFVRRGIQIENFVDNHTQD